MLQLASCHCTLPPNFEKTETVFHVSFGANVNSTCWKNIPCRAKTNFGLRSAARHMQGSYIADFTTLDESTQSQLLTRNRSRVAAAWWRPWCTSTFWQTVRRLSIEIIISKKVSFLIMQVALFTSEVVKIYKGKFESNFATAGVRCTENKQNPRKHYRQFSINSLRPKISVSKNKNFCKEKKSYCRGRFRPKPKKLNVNDEQFPTFEVVNILRSNIRDFKELCRIGSSVFKAPFPAFQAMRLKTHLDYSCESATTFIGWFACCKKLRKVSIYATHCPTVFYSSSLRLV